MTQARTFPRMYAHWAVPVVWTALAAVSLCTTAFAQTPAPRKPAAAAPPASKTPGGPSDPKANLSGVWRTRTQPADFNDLSGPGLAAGKSKGWFGKDFKGGGYGFVDSKMEPPVMLPAAAAQYKATREGSYEYLQPLKPLEPWVNCIPSSVPWVYDLGAPFEIIQTPKKVVMLFELEGHWREIFLDGRKNPEGAPNTFMGYSTGHWEGNTLVVETIGLNDLTWLDRLGHTHSDELKMQERMYRVSPDRMDIDFLFDDPKTYAKPWKGKKIFLADKSDIVESFTCEDKWQKEYPETLRKEIGETKGPQ